MAAAGGGGAAACPPRVDILATRDVGAEPCFLLRLTQHGAAEASYFLKRFSELRALDGQLRAAAATRTWASEGAITSVPALPKQGAFGLRRALSTVGVGSFSQRQVETLTAYMEEVLKQIPSIAADPDLQEFFRGIESADVADMTGDQYDKFISDGEVMKEMLLELRSGRASLRAIEGYWRIEGTDALWQVEASGRACLDGTHRGEDCDVAVSEEDGARVISCPTGWRVDLDRSTDQKVRWTLPGHADIVWVREETSVAQERIRKLLTVRERLKRLGTVTIH
uniref:PX domain-containing protein n=1 Tax=Zooxanthella nutricula TaxID=1333877 RepID=A0A7S2KKY0_9DINO